MPAKKIFYSFLMSFSILSLAACSSASPDVAKNDAEKEDITKEEKKLNEVHTAQWSYEGETGPEHWGDLNSDYKVCTSGKRERAVPYQHRNFTSQGR